ncbi:unnamed protein product [Alopecurus aequalis]
MRIVLLLVAITTLSYAVAMPATAMPGVWFKINNITAPHIRDVGKWAVTEHTKMGAGDGIKFEKVVSGEEQILNGISYRLIIHAVGPYGSHDSYMVWVLEQDPSNPKTWKLVNFSPLD